MKKPPKSLSRSLTQTLNSTSIFASNPNPNPPSPSLPFHPPQTPPSPHPTLSPLPSSPSHLARFLQTHFLQTPSSITPSSLLPFLKRLRHHPSLAAYDLHVFRWAADLDSFRHDHHTFEWIAKTLAITHRYDDLRYVLDFMRTHPCPCGDGVFSCPRLESIYKFAIVGFVRSGRFDVAEVTFKELKASVDGKVCVEVYNVVMNGFRGVGMHERVLEWYDVMLRDGVRPDLVTFNVLIGSCCRNSRFDEAMRLFGEMRVVGLRPNVISFNTLIGGFFRVKKFEEGIGIAREMLDLGYGFSDVTCEILVDGLCRCGRVEDGCGVLMEIVKRGALPDGFDCLGLVEALCGDGKVDKCFEIMMCLRENGKLPSVVTCCTLLESLVKRGKMDDAITLVEVMVEKNMILDCFTFNGFVEAMCESGRSVEANKLRVLASRVGFQPDPETFRILVGGFSREKRTKEGESLVHEMLDEGFISNITAYNRLMEGLLSYQRKKIWKT